MQLLLMGIHYLPLRRMQICNLFVLSSLRYSETFVQNEIPDYIALGHYVSSSEHQYDASEHENEQTNENNRWFAEGRQ